MQGACPSLHRLSIESFEEVPMCAMDTRERALIRQSGLPEIILSAKYPVCVRTESTVPGDRIIAVNSLDGALTNNEQTASGGVVVATVNKKPFTFILETERGLNLSIQAVPREGAGRTIQLVSDLRGTGEEAGAWETSTPYESLLVTISQAVRGGKLPAGWYQVPVTKETLQAPAGLSSVADAVWTGNHLKMVRFAVENKTLSALNIRESDFWQPGTRAVMFSQPASQLLAGARMDVYVTRDGEGN
ncbi:type-F conjugative transfer system secretin TraK [Escherichia coli]|nr:type-F conjugative transfer system secretin TraK [Escherichia coli]